MERTDRPHFRKNPIYFNTFHDAVAVVYGMYDVLNKYGVVSVLDMYDLSEVACDFKAHQYGWTDLSNVYIKPVPGIGYTLSTPYPVRLDDDEPYTHTKSATVIRKDLGEPIIIDDEDYSYEERKLLKRVFNVPEEASRFVISDAEVSYFVEKPKPKESKHDFTNWEMACQEVFEAFRKYPDKLASWTGSFSDFKEMIEKESK